MRIFFFFRFLNGFLDECNRVISTKLAFAKQNTDEIETKLDKLATQLRKLENTRKEVINRSYKL